MFDRKTKFLIVDDMNMFRRMVRQALNTLEYSNLTEANDGTTALAALEEAVTANEPFDFIICDWNMPKMKGIDLLKAVRSSSWGKTLPFLLLTAEAEKAKVIESMKEGVDGYLVKPFTVNALQANLQGIYQKKFGAKAS